MITKSFQKDKHPGDAWHIACQICKQKKSAPKYTAGKPKVKDKKAATDNNYIGWTEDLSSAAMETKGSGKISFHQKGTVKEK